MEEEEKSGIVYFLQPKELLGTTRYKIGFSEKMYLERCIKGYKKGTRYICIMDILNPNEVEKELKYVFSIEFKLIAGSEYFEGDEVNMMNTFHKIVMKHKTKKNLEIKNEENVEENYDNNKPIFMKWFREKYEMIETSDENRKVINEKKIFQDFVIDTKSNITFENFEKITKEIGIMKTGENNIPKEKNGIFYINIKSIVFKREKICNRIDPKNKNYNKDKEKFYEKYMIEKNMIESWLNEYYDISTTIKNRISKEQLLSEYKKNQENIENELFLKLITYMSNTKFTKKYIYGIQYKSKDKDEIFNEWFEKTYEIQDKKNPKGEWIKVSESYEKFKEETQSSIAQTTFSLKVKKLKIMKTGENGIPKDNRGSFYINLKIK